VGGRQSKGRNEGERGGGGCYCGAQTRRFLLTFLLLPWVAHVGNIMERKQGLCLAVLFLFPLPDRNTEYMTIGLRV